jgi:hypothetical protein
MKTFPKSAIVLCFPLMLLSQAEAGQDEAPASSDSGSPGVVVKVENAIERGARAAASGVERGARAAASGVERGVKAAASGVARGASAAADAASHVANKINGTPASSPSSGK